MLLRKSLLDSVLILVQIPVAAFVFVYMYTTGRSLSDSCTVVRAMSQAYFLDLEVPDGRFLIGRHPNIRFDTSRFLQGT